MARTETGSVAEIKEENAKLSLKENTGTLYPSKESLLTQKNIKVDEIMAMNVPRKAYMKIEPMLLKKTRLEFESELTFSYCIQLQK